MIVRDAEEKDTDGIVEMVREMHKDSMYKCMSFDEDVMLSTILYSFREGSRFYFQVCEDEGEIVGAMGASCSSHFFSKDLIACDLFIYVTPISSLEIFKGL